MSERETCFDPRQVAEPHTCPGRCACYVNHFCWTGCACNHCPHQYDQSVEWMSEYARAALGEESSDAVRRRHER